MSAKGALLSAPSAAAAQCAAGEGELRLVNGRCLTSVRASRRHVDAPAAGGRREQQVQSRSRQRFLRRLDVDPVAFFFHASSRVEESDDRLPESREEIGRMGKRKIEVR